MLNFERYISLARALTPDDHNQRCYHTTFILKKNKVVSVGINKNKTNAKNLNFNYYGKNGCDMRSYVGCHSELMAVVKYGKTDCSDCVFINVRIDNNGEVNQSKYCRGCQSILAQVGFKKAYYSNEHGLFSEFDLPAKVS